MSDSTPEPTPAGRSARRLAQLGCLLPVAAVAVFLLVLFAWPHERHAAASDLQTVLFFVSMAAVPVAAIVGIALAVTAMIRARRDAADARQPSPRLAAPVAIVVALACVAITIPVIWAALEGLSGFR